MTAGFTYIDNQEILKFPLELVMDRMSQVFDKFYLFLSDDDEIIYSGYAIKEGKMAEIIDVNIETPSDISKAFNICLEKSLYYSQADFVSSVPADIAIIPDKFIKSFENIKDTKECYVHPQNLVRMYINFGIAEGGIITFGRDCKKRMYDDGSIKDAIVLPEVDNIEVGYMTIAQYYNHNKSHKKLWNNPIDLSLYEKGDIEGFLNQQLKHIKETRWSIADNMKEMIDIVKLWDKEEEMEYVTNIFNKL